MFFIYLSGTYESIVSTLYDKFRNVSRYFWNYFGTVWNILGTKNILR